MEGSVPNRVVLVGFLTDELEWSETCFLASDHVPYAPDADVRKLLRHDEYVRVLESLGYRYVFGTETNDDKWVEVFEVDFQPEMSSDELVYDELNFHPDDDTDHEDEELNDE